MPHTFTDSEFMTADEKRRVLRAWRRFLLGELQYKQFTKSLYQHLTQSCGFIALYDRSGFYSHYFGRGGHLAEFLREFSPSNTDYWTRNDYDYADINQAMIEVAAPYIAGLLATAYQAKRAEDLAIARGILERYGIESPV